MALEQRVRLIDIETFPNIGYTWGKWEQNVIKFVKEWELASFAYKWLGEKEVICETRQNNSEKQLVTKLRSVISSSPIIVAHNGDQFDLKKSRTKFIQFDLKPPAINRSVDTKKIAKSQFAFNSNSLGDLGEYLGLGKKADTGGFDLWLACMDGDPAAWAKMAHYNKVDVQLLERVYLKLRAWAPNHPNLAAFEERPGCAVCASVKIQFRGSCVLRKKLSKRYQCQECGHWGTV